MTKKHYEAIAAIFADAKPRDTESRAHETWEKIVGAFAQYAKHDNPRFDILRFFAACNGIKR